MDIRARTLFSFSPLIILLVGMVIALPIIEQRSQAIRTEQVAAADDLSDTQRMGLALLLEHVAVDQIARATLRPDSARYTAPHAEIAELLDRHAGFAHPSEELDRQAAAAYTELGDRYERIVAFASEGDMAAAQRIYDDPRTFSLLNDVLGINQAARDAARQQIDRADQRSQMAQRHAFQTIAVVLLFGILIAVGLSWTLVSQIVSPIERLTADAEHYASGDIAGQLSAVSTIGQIRRLRDAFQHLLDANTARQARIQQNLDELSERVAREERLRETVQALSVPVVPLQEGMLLLPLIGHLDDRRAAELTRGLLDAIHRTRARAVVLDITGLADLDAAGSLALSHTVAAARLLGCRVFLVGIRASQAVALSESPLAAADIVVARDIPSVLAQARNMV